MQKRGIGRKGVTHVEIILSFALFLGIVIAVFIFLRPVREPQLSSVMLDIAELGFKNETTITLGSLAFNVDTNPLLNPNWATISCFTVTHPLDIGTGAEQLKSNNVFVESSDGADLKFLLSSDIAIEKRGTFYYIFFSFDETFLQNALGSCPPENTLAAAAYTYSVPRTEQLISRQKLEQLKTLYTQDYAELKKKWFLPARNDFEIRVEDASGLIYNLEREIPPNKDVFSREITLNMLDQTSGIQVKQIHVLIKVW